MYSWLETSIWMLLFPIAQEAGTFVAGVSRGEPGGTRREG